MTSDDLGRDRRLDVGKVEGSRLGRQLGVQHDLQPEVAEFSRERRGRASLEGVVDLVRLLEQVLAQGHMGLFAVPRAAIGLARRAESGMAHGPATASSGAIGAR
jgi:hypothetical protein